MAQSVEEYLPRKFRVLSSVPIGRKEKERGEVGKHPSLGGRPGGKIGNLKADGGK